MKGTRRPDNTPQDQLLPGEYCHEAPTDPDLLAQYPHGWWNIHMPALGPHGAAYGQVHGGPNGWRIFEYPDGTITVEPSIKLSTTSGRELWHGYLTAGVWSWV